MVVLMVVVASGGMLVEMEAEADALGGNMAAVACLVGVLAEKMATVGTEEARRAAAAQEAMMEVAVDIADTS